MGQVLVRLVQGDLNQISQGTGAPIPSSPDIQVSTPLMDAWNSAKALQILHPVSPFYLGTGSDTSIQMQVVWQKNKRNYRCAQAYVGMIPWA